MSRDLLASKIVVSEAEPKVRGIPSVPTSVVGAVGVTEQGPYNKPVLCTSFDEYQQTFGGYVLGADVPLAAKGFFENGGSRLWVSRILSSTAVAASATLVASVDTSTPAQITGFNPGPYSFESGSAIQVTVSGVTTNVVLSGESAVVNNNSFDTTFPLFNNATLLVSVDGGPTQTVTFLSSDFDNIGNASGPFVADVIRNQLTGASTSVYEGGDHLSITSDSAGTASSIVIVGGTAASILHLAGLSATGIGTLPNINAVMPADMQAAIIASGGDNLFRAVDASGYLRFETVALGSSATLQLFATFSFTDPMVQTGMDSSVYAGTDGDVQVEGVLTVEASEPGADGNRLSVLLLPPTGGDPSAFDLAVQLDGEQVEIFRDLTRTPSDARYAPTIVNAAGTGSQYITLTDFVGVSTGLPPDTPNTAFLAAGDDGLSGITEADFVGDEAAETGLYALDAVPDLTMLIVPGQATSAVHNAMIAYCEQHRDGTVFAILDPPDGYDAQGMVDYVSAEASLENLSEFGAIYWPRVKVANPDKDVFGPGTQIVVAPSGIIAGVYCRTDGGSPGGVYNPPAGISRGRMFGVLGFWLDETLDERKRDVVYPHRVNPLTSGPGLPRFIDGARTLKGDGSFPFVAERRGVMFIEQSLRQGLQFARHENNTPELRAQVRRTITAFLLTQMRNGAFQTQDPTTAFYVDVSDKLNPPSVVAAGKLVVRVGLATNKPAEYVLLEISQDTRLLEEELATAG